MQKQMDNNNERSKLFHAASSDRLSHAYIASGAAADSIIMTAVCSGNGAKPCMECANCRKASRRIHPDITYIERLPDKREITVDQIREIKRDVIVIPTESEKKVFIINDADTLNRNAQNALLQLLEEPPTYAVFILKTDSPAQLITTIHSRCVEIKAHSDRTGADHDSDAGDMVGRFFSALESGNAALTRFMFRLEKLEKDSFEAFLETARGQAIDYLRSSEPDCGKINRATLSRADRVLVKCADMLNLNVSTGHISGFLCASLMTGTDIR